MIFSAACQVVSFVFLLAFLILTPTILVNCLALAAFVGSFLYVSYVIGNILDTLPRFRASSKRKAVVVVGCDQGFGKLLAQRLDSIGYKVFAGCLQPSGEGAESLKDSCTSRLEVLNIDVRNEKSVIEASQFVENNLKDCELWAVVNNAGIVSYGELEWTNLDEYKKLFEVNTFGLVRVAQAFLPLLRKFKGRLVVTTSFGGNYTFPGIAPYCMSKSAAVSFCDGLRLEMDKFSVKVVSVEPFAYKTGMTDLTMVYQKASDMWDKAPKSLKTDYSPGYLEAFKRSIKKYNSFSTNPDIHDVIDALVEAVTVTSPHPHYVVGDLKAGCFSWIIRKLPPWISDYIVKHYVIFDDEMRQFLIRNNGKVNGKKL